MPLVSRLSLSHFRSYTYLDLPFDQRPTVLFGANGSGKTNILEAISLLSPGRGLRRSKSVEFERAPDHIGWRIRADLAFPSDLQQVETGLEGAGRYVKINDKAVPQTALGKLTRVLWLVPAMDRLWIEAASGRRQFLDRLTLTFIPDHAATSLAYEKAMRSRNRLLKEGPHDPAWFDSLERQMAQHGAALHHNRVQTLEKLVRAQKSTETSFPVAALSIQSDHLNDLKDEASLVEALRQSRPRDIAAGRSLKGPHLIDLEGVYQEKSMPAAQCSTGEQKALLVSLLLAASRVIADEFKTTPFLLLDEVAAHLDSERRAALFDEILAIGAQAWFTGTDRNLFEHLEARANFLYVSTSDKISKVEFT